MSKSSNKAKVETLKLWVEDVKRRRKYVPKKHQSKTTERD